MHNHFSGGYSGGSWIELVSAIVSFFGVCVAAWAAASANQAAKQSKLATQAAYMPMLEPVLVQPKDSNVPQAEVYRLNIRNIGQGLARHIHLAMPEFNGSFECLSLSPDKTNVEVRTFYPHLGSNNFVDIVHRAPDHTISWRLVYKDLFENEIITIVRIKENNSMQWDRLGRMSLSWTIESQPYQDQS